MLCLMLSRASNVPTNKVTTKLAPSLRQTGTQLVIPDKGKVSDAISCGLKADPGRGIPLSLRGMALSP